MPARTDLERLEELIGHRFADRGHLELALRHSSWCNEQAVDSAVLEDNERLEFLGDAVLDLVVGHRLMNRYPQLREGELSVTRAQVVSEAGLHEIAAKLGLGDWLLLGKGKSWHGDDSAPAALDLFDSKISSNGVTIGRYRPAGEVRTGSFVSEEPSEAEIERREKWHEEEMA